MTTKITSLEGLTPLTGADIATSYVFETEEFFLADDVRALLASQAELADEIERRTEEISVAHANPVGRSRAALLHDVECLLGHIALLRGAAPPLSQPHQAVVAAGRAGWEAAATAISDRAAGHDQMGNFTEADECRTCVSMLHDLKSAAPLPPAPTPARPTDDELWDQTIHARETYHEWADKLAEAISKHFGAYIGEHSNTNCPWAEALEAIEGATRPLPVGQALDLAALTDDDIEELAVDYYRAMTDSIDDVIGFARAVERHLRSPGNPVSENGGAR